MIGARDHRSCDFSCTAAQHLYARILSGHFQCLQGLWAIHALVSNTEQMPDAMPEFTIYYFKLENKTLS